MAIKHAVTEEQEAAIICLLLLSDDWACVLVSLWLSERMVQTQPSRLLLCANYLIIIFAIVAQRASLVFSGHTADTEHYVSELMINDQRHCVSALRVCHLQD